MGTNGNRFEGVSSALLLTEYNSNKQAEKQLKKVIQEQRDEIERRLNAGLAVENDKTFAQLSTVNYKIYNVRSILTAIRKFKLDAGAILKGINKAIEALPAHILETIPFVTESGTRLTVKARK